MSESAMRAAWMGRQPYGPVHALQRELQAARRAGGDDLLLLLEHDAVFTLGRQHDVPKWRDADGARAARIPVVQTERGGDITYHGPGQLVAYAIIRLGDRNIGAGDLVRGLEEAAIRTLGRWGIEATRDARNRGAWVGGRKIAQVGISVRGGVSMHGLALNVSPDPAHFALIEACGLPDVETTSMASETDLPGVTVEQVALAFASEFADVFGRRVAMVEPPPLPGTGWGASAGD